MKNGKLLLPAMCIYAPDTGNCKCRNGWVTAVIM